MDAGPAVPVMEVSGVTVAPDDQEQNKVNNVTINKSWRMLEHRSAGHQQYAWTLF